jgi:EAL domain-containing protein (putative c-di-GMP-specific phosphodiesterase class I)
MDAEVRARLDLERDLRGALSRREFELHYQPIVSLGDDRVVALEALLRWRHPKIGLLGPDTFLSVIEETGLVVPIGRWVMQEACSQLKLWRTELGENAPERVAVNLSVRQAIQPDLVADVATALDQSDLDPAMLEIELTEHALMDHSATATRALHGLSRLGVRLGIDDFGAGYSSFGRLQHLPIDHLKIDRSFLQNMLKDSTSNVLIGAMAGLGRALRLEVTAEGIEFEAEVVRLTELGCDYGQGHFFAAAMPAETVTTFLTARPRREIEPAAADPGTVVPFPTGRVASK